jgi:hypothetical protein
VIALSRRAAAWAFIGLTAASALAQNAARDPRVVIDWISDTPQSNRVVVQVAGLKKDHVLRLGSANWQASQWQQLLGVYAEQGDPLRDPWLPPMVGRYAVERDKVRFTPQFPLQPGVVYRAIFRPERLPSYRDKAASVTSTFRIAAPDFNPTTVVSAVYPSADVVPENLLKFYVHFSAPMSRGRIYDHIHLYNEKGGEVELPFLEIDEELWDPAMTRLTLFIDPGRIKREVTPLEEIGPALEAGKRFTLAIDKGWADATGNPLKKDFRKEFAVSAADREPPDPARWSLNVPPAGTREKLTVKFPEPMDDALARRLIRVRSTSGIVAGETRLTGLDQAWEFVPDGPWATGKHDLLIQTTIEDLAGNNIGKPFEVDLFEGVQRRLTNTTVTLSFQLK